MKNLPSRRAAMGLLGAASVWALLWAVPWQRASAGYGAWITTGLSVLVFAIPGACLFGMLSSGAPRILTGLAAGFVLSHLIVACLGLLGRVLGLSFQMVKYGFAAAGLLCIATFLLLKSRRGAHLVDWQSVLREAREAWPLVVLIALGLLLSLRHTFTDDDLSYLAYVTNWQFAQKLSFGSILFGPQLLDASRFWLSLLPMSYALLSEVSRIPGILLMAGYLQPFLTVLALAALYELGRALGLPAKWAAGAVGLQLAFLVLWGGVQPLGGVASNLAGQMFFARMAEDKALATFLFAPVLVISALSFQQHPTTQNLTAMVLIGFAFCLLHPVALAYTLLIIALFSMLRYIAGRGLREIAITLGVLVVVIIPQGILRFVSNPLTDTVTSVTDAANIEPTLFSRLVLLQKGGFFYGFNPQLLELDLPWIQSSLFREIVGWGWLVLAGIITILAIRRVRDSDAARYLLACTALITIAGVPYLGWLLGYFVSAQLLYRTLWFYPFGLGVAFAVWELARRRAAMPPVVSHSENLLANALLWIGILFAAFAAWSTTPAALKDLHQKISTYGQYVALGRSLDAVLSKQAIVMAPGPIGNYLPGLSGHARVVSFRNWRQGVYYGLSVEDAKARAADLARFYAANVPAEERLSILNRYHAAFVIVRTSREEDGWVRAHPEAFYRVGAIKGYALFRFDADAAAEGNSQMVLYSIAMTPRAESAWISR